MRRSVKARAASPGGILLAQPVEDALLGVQGVRAGTRKVILADLVQAGAAGGAVPARSSGLQGLAALGRVQGAGARMVNELRSTRAGGMRTRAAFTQETAVPGAGEGDRQMPGHFPRAAVLLLHGGAVPREAAGAVAGAGREQPVIEDERGARAGPGARDGRVAVGPGDERQGAGLAGGQPRGPGEALDVKGQQEAAADRR